MGKGTSAESLLKELEADAAEASVKASKKDVDADAGADSADQRKLDFAVKVLAEEGIDPQSRGMTAEEAVEKAERLLARRQSAVQVLARGQTVDALASVIEKLPSDREGQFVRDTPGDIARAEALGFRIELGMDVKGLHDTGDNRVKVGDTVLMTIDRDEKRVVDRVRITERNRKNRVQSVQDQFRNVAASANTGGSFGA